MSEKPNTIVTVAKVKFGNALPLAVIAGPCALESRAHAFDTASALKEISAKLQVGFVYKTSFDKANRTSASSARGLGLDKALAIFADLRNELGIPVLTDVHEPDQCAPVAEVVDVLQIPAFLCRQTDLLVAAARTGRPINVKKGQFLAPWDMGNVVAKITAAGNPNVLVTERGGKASEIKRKRCGILSFFGLVGHGRCKVGVKGEHFGGGCRSAANEAQCDPQAAAGFFKERVGFLDRTAVENEQCLF